MSGVKDLIAKLDAAKLQEEADRLKKIQEAQEASKREATLVQERQRLEKVLFFLSILMVLFFCCCFIISCAEEEEERRKLKAAEEERLKWKVDEEDAARDVLERKKRFLEQQKQAGYQIRLATFSS